MISVIIPTYNRADVIHVSIESVLKQTYGDFELIIIDDGSSDDTKRVVAGYDDPRIRYVRNDSDMHGPSAARNMGILEARGDYIAFNDSDDAWYADKLEKQLDYLHSEGADITFCQMFIPTEKGSNIIPSKLRVRDCNVRTDLCGSFTGTPAILGKRECFLHELFDERMLCNEDWELMIRLLDRYKVVFQPEVMVNVTISRGSVSESKERAIVAMNYILEKHAKLYSKYPLSRLRMVYFIKYQKALLDDNKISRYGCSIIINLIDFLLKLY